MANMIKCKVILQIKDSPRGNFTKMLVVRTPLNYNTSAAFVRQHGVDGMVLAYQANGIRPKVEQATGKKIWEFDDGLVYFPLKHDTKGVQVDAEIHGSNLVIHHLPPEIYNSERYAEVDAPSKIPVNGTPVRIMKPIEIKLSHFKTDTGWYMAVAVPNLIAKKMERGELAAFGTSGFQLVASDKGNKISQNPGSVTTSVKFAMTLLPFRIPPTTVKAFVLPAKYDEASQSIIAEDAIDVLTQKARDEREIPTPPKAPHVPYLSRISPEEQHKLAVAGGKARWAKRKDPPHKPGKANTDIIGLVALLEKHFTLGVYDLGYDDARVARETGMKEAFVAQIREVQFGPIKVKNPQVDELKKKLEEIQKQLAALGT